MDFKIPISQLMTTNPVTVSPSDRMSTIKDIFDTKKIHHVLVINQTKLVGIVSREDYKQLARCTNTSSYTKLISESRLYNYRVEEVMTRDIATLESTERIGVALELFAKNLFSAIPIVDGEELAGLLTTYDIIKSLVAEMHGPDHKPVNLTISAPER